MRHFIYTQKLDIHIFFNFAETWADYAGYMLSKLPKKRSTLFFTCRNVLNSDASLDLKLTLFAQFFFIISSSPLLVICNRSKWANGQMGKEQKASPAQRPVNHVVSGTIKWKST